MIDWKNHRFPISINNRIINKNELNDVSANSDGYDPRHLIASELLGFIKKGFAYSSVFDGTRSKNNFVRAGFLSLDFDAAESIEEILHDPFVKEAATVIYTTRSHTNKNPKFRIIFVLETPIESADDLRMILRSLALRLGSDIAAAEPARQFYGNTECKSLIRPFGLSTLQTEELLAQSINAGKSENVKGAHSTGRSNLAVPSDQKVTTSSNEDTLLSELEKSTSIFCPFHADKNASAFVIKSQSGVSGIHCSACGVSYWPKEEEFDFGTFDQAINDSLSSVKQFDPLEPFYETTENPIYPILDGTGKDKPKPILPNIQIINSEFLPYLKIIKGKNYIKSPKGSGKTQFLSKLVRDKPVYVLLIGHRRSLIRQLCERLDLECYLDDKAKQHRFGVCLDSLAMVRDDTHYDYILVDESEQLLAHFLSETMIGKRNSVITRLQRLILNSKYLVALDADLSWPTFRFFSQCKQFGKSGANSAIFLNEAVGDHKKISIFDSKAHLVEKIFQSIKNGDRCFVTSNSKRMIDRLHASIEDKFPERSIIKVTSDNSGQEKIQSFLSNIQKEALKYSVILTTPSVSTGIDISFENNEQQIDHVFGIFEPLILTHFECDQQLSRVRNPKTTSVFVSPARFSFETNIDVVSRDLQVGFLNEELIDGYDSDGQIKYRIESPLLNLGCAVVSIQRASKNNLKKHFIDHKRSQGFEIEIVASNPESASKGTAILSNGKSIFDNKYRQRLLNANCIQNFEFLIIQEKLDDNIPINDVSLASFHRTAIEQFYHQALTSELIDLDDRGSFRRKVHLFIQLTKLTDADLRTPSDKRDELLSVVLEVGDQVHFLRDTLESAGIYSDGKFLREIEITTKSLSNFSKFLRMKKTQFETVFGTPLRSDIASKPVSQLTYLFKKVGLATESLPIRYEGKQKIYSYRINSEKLDQMLEIVKIREESSGFWVEPKTDSKLSDS